MLKTPVTPEQKLLSLFWFLNRIPIEEKQTDGNTAWSRSKRRDFPSFPTPTMMLKPSDQIAAARTCVRTHFASSSLFNNPPLHSPLSFSTPFVKSCHSLFSSRLEEQLLSLNETSRAIRSLILSSNLTGSGEFRGPDEGRNGVSRSL